MINNYGMYNNHKLDNTLLLIFSCEKFNRSISLSKEMEILYKDDEVVGYRIKNFIRYAKIKYSGIIFLPANPLIDVINSILRKYNLEPLGYKKSSGYVTRKNEDKLMVFALKGTYMIDGNISKGQFCTYHDLDINDDQSLFVIDEEIKENIDFFSMEEI